MESTQNQSSTTEVNLSGVAVHCAHDALVDITELIPNPRNPNKHGDKQVALLAKIIRHQGWRAPITVSKRSGFIVTGHGRLEAAKLLQVQTVPVDFQDFATEADEWAHLVADNRIAELAEIDSGELSGLLKELEAAGVDLDLAGFDAEALVEVEGFAAPESDVDAEPQMDRAAELQKEWGTATGQLWKLGEHRLMCGDSTKREDVARLLDGAVPLLMVTDPPYGVSYDATWRKAALPDTNPGKTGGMHGKVENDDRSDWRDAWALFPGDVIYSWHPAGAPSLVHAAALQDSGFPIRMQIIWAKNQFPIGRGDYHVKHEPCWYCVREGKPSLMVDDRTQHTLWEIDKPHKSETGHSTQKPIECMAKPIRNHKSPMVYDPFLGSGTTLIAAEGLGRKCYGLEISPGYCAVILQRFKDATGKTPTLTPC